MITARIADVVSQKPLGFAARRAFSQSMPRVPQRPQPGDGSREPIWRGPFDLSEYCPQNRGQEPLERASYSCRKSSEKFHRRELLDESTLISLQRL